MAAGGKDEKYPTTPARVAFKAKTPTRTHSTAELPGQRMAAVGPGRDMGAGQIAKGGSVEGGRRSQPRRKENALYYSSSFSLGEKENFPKPRPQYFIRQTQGTWFDLTERERPSPHAPGTHTLPSSPRKLNRHSPLQSGTLSHSSQPGDPLKAEAAPVGNTTDTGGQICSSGRGRSSNREEPETRIAVSTSQSERLNH